MKFTFNIFALILLCCIASNAQTKTITISEDAFVQGGETADEALGETKLKNLMVSNSKQNTKFSRITYMKFSLPKKMAEVTKVELNIPIKVFKNEGNPELTFNLEVVGVNDDNWSELKITWNTKPELAQVLGTAELQQSLNNEIQWIKLILDVQEFNKLYNKDKDREVTLALVNNKSNKISATAPSKESNSKNAAYLILD